MQGLITFALLASAASWTTPFAARHWRVRHRSGPVTCGAVATFCKDRLRISEEIAQRTEARLQHRAEYINATMAASICDALQSRLGLSEAQLQKVVVALPSVLGYSFESNIEPKLDFLQMELGLSLDVMRAKVLKCPAVLGYSLARRYFPRLQVCREVGADPILVVDRVTQTDERFYASIGSARGP